MSILLSHFHYSFQGEFVDDTAVYPSFSTSSARVVWLSPRERRSFYLLSLSSPPACLFVLIQPRKREHSLLLPSFLPFRWSVTRVEDYTRSLGPCVFQTLGKIVLCFLRTLHISLIVLLSPSLLCCIYSSVVCS